MRRIPARAFMLAVAAFSPLTPGQVVSPLAVAPSAGAGPVTELVLDPAACDSLRALLAESGEAVVERFPLSLDRTIDLRVTPVEVFSVGARLVASSDAGDAPAAPPDVLLLSARGADGVSRGFLALSPSGCNGFLELRGHIHIVSSGPPGAGLPPVVYDLSSLPEGVIDWDNFVCGQDILLPHSADNPGDEAAPAGPLPCRVAKIAVESDFEYTSAVFGGDADAALAYIATLVGAVSEIYTADLNTRLEVSYARVWKSDTDPYSGGTEARFYQFQSHWNAKMGGVERAAAHMLSGAKGEWGGIGWIGGLCSNGSAYAISDHIRGFFPYPLEDRHKQNWDLMVFAHELGHNFNAPHTHDMSPPIDRCGFGDCSKKEQGTIMSYCNTCTGGTSNIALTLHVRIINEKIIPFLNSWGGSCLDEADAPTITQQPQSQSACEGASAIFTVKAKPGPLAFQWRKGGADIPGQTKAALTIDPVGPGDAGVYTVLVANGCGEVLSNGAALSIGSCPADLTGDCILDVFDYLAFLNLFEQETPEADCDGDGEITLHDFLCFVNAYNDGC